ncbi:transcriptional regulator [Obesumbacterium proteus]|uniref:transcriptional antitermination N peptide n=1 Tax=Obesumbacterium proteus TaxID=82983 RepID=UPI0024328CBD|nr:transcriptional regulator [Obesumbacterium proteus]
MTMAKVRAKVAARKIQAIAGRKAEDRTVKALSLPTPVVRGEEEVTGSCCLPQVAIFAAGHRKSESVTAR